MHQEVHDDITALNEPSLFSYPNAKEDIQELIIPNFSISKSAFKS